MDAGQIAFTLKLINQLTPEAQRAAKDLDQLRPAANQVAAALDPVEGKANQAAKALRNVDDPARQSAQGMSVLKASFLGFTLGSALEQAPQILAGLGRATFTAASDTSESLNKVRVVFGQTAGEIEAFAKGAAQNLGLSRQAALEATGTFGNLFVSMGMGQPAAAEMSMGIVQLASDLATGREIRVTFDSEVASKHEVELVSTRHPLVALALRVVEETAVSMRRFGVVGVPGLPMDPGRGAEAPLSQGRQPQAI